jgi:hypothetical protein
MKFRKPNPRRLFVAIEKKSLIDNLKTTKKAIVASTPAEAKVSPRTLSRIHTRVKGSSPINTRVRYTH